MFSSFACLLPLKMGGRLAGTFLLCLLVLLFLLPSSLANPRASWRPPVEGQLQVLTPFEQPAARWASGHRGVDLALEPGQAIVAPAEGRVIFSGRVVDRQVLTLEHPDGRRSSFEPVTDSLPVGSQVQAGQVLARLDPEIEHCSPSFCLHWGLREPSDDPRQARRGLAYTNPLLLLGLEEPSVLLPVGPDFGA